MDFNRYITTIEYKVAVDTIKDLIQKDHHDIREIVFIGPSKLPCMLDFDLLDDIEERLSIDAFWSAEPRHVIDNKLNHIIFNIYYVVDMLKGINL